MKLNYSSVFVWNLIVSPQIITIYTVYMILPISSLSFSKWQSIGWFCYTEKYSQIPQLSSNTVCSTSLPHSLPHKKGIVILLFFNAHLKAFKFSIFNCLVPKLTENFSHHTSYECSLIGNDKLHTEWDSCVQRTKWPYTNYTEMSSVCIFQFYNTLKSKAFNFISYQYPS